MSKTQAAMLGVAISLISHMGTNVLLACVLVGVIWAIAKAK
jgi:hypothetical protein